MYDRDLKQYIFKGIKTDYFVSTDGNIYSNKKGKLYKLKPTKSSRGYLKVRLSINGHVYNRNIHRIVAETFIPNPENKPEVNHKDGNKKNNKVTNLEWATRKENEDHAYKTGLLGIGEDFPASDISNDQCIKICEMLQNTKISIPEISKIVGCSRKIVHDIFHKKTWVYISNNYDFSSRKTFDRITIDTAKQICELLSSTIYNSKEIANIVGCKVQHVKDIKRGKTWKNISKNYDI